MEDILTSTGTIDAMAEEIIRPTRGYQTAKSPSSPQSSPLKSCSLANYSIGRDSNPPQSASSFAAESTVDRESSSGDIRRSKVAQEGSEQSVASSTTSGFGLTRKNSDGEGRSGSTGGVGIDDLSSNKGKRDSGTKQPQAEQQQGGIRTAKSDGDAADQKSKPGTPPKLPPKPPGLLEKVKDKPSGSAEKATEKEQVSTKKSYEKPVDIRGKTGEKSHLQDKVQEKPQGVLDKVKAINDGSVVNSKQRTVEQQDLKGQRKQGPVSQAQKQAPGSPKVPRRPKSPLILSGPSVAKSPVKSPKDLPNSPVKSQKEFPDGARSNDGFKSHRVNDGKKSPRNSKGNHNSRTSDGITARELNRRPFPKPEQLKPSHKPLRNPLAVTRSVQLTMSSPSSKDTRDGIQRTCSSPLAAETAASENSPLNSMDQHNGTQHSTESQNKSAPGQGVKSRVHHIQENLIHGHQEPHQRQKKLSVMDKKIKVRERAAVFEKIVQGISEETSVVLLDVDAAGPRKRCARKNERLVAQHSNASRTASDSSSLTIRTVSESSELNNEYESAHIEATVKRTPKSPIPHPVPRPRSNIPTVKEAPERVVHAPLPPAPTPQPRTSLIQPPTLAAASSNSELLANSKDIYDEIQEFAQDSELTAKLPLYESADQTSAVPTSASALISSQPDSQELNLPENMYEDTLFRDPAAADLYSPQPQLSLEPPHAPPRTNTCPDSLAPLDVAGGLFSDEKNSTAAAPEMIVTDESRSRAQRESIYEVCIGDDNAIDQPAHAGDVSAVVLVAGAVTDIAVNANSPTVQEMPSELSAVDLITTIEDEGENDRIGTHKLSRQRRQRHFAVKMRSTESSAPPSRRTGGEVKRHGRSLPDINLVQEKEQEEEVEEERKGDGSDNYDVLIIEPSGSHLVDINEDHASGSGSDGNEYEEVPYVPTSDEEREKGWETKPKKQNAVQIAEEEREIIEELKEVEEEPKEEDVEEKEESEEEEFLRQEKMDAVEGPIKPGRIRERTKTSPENLQRGRQMKKRYSEGAFEDFVPLFLQKPGAAKDGSAVNDNTNDSRLRQDSKPAMRRPKSEGTIVMADIKEIRAELEKRNAARNSDVEAQASILKDELAKDTKDKDDDSDPDSYAYVTEFDLDNGNSSTEDSDYEQVCDMNDQQLSLAKKPGSKSSTSGAVFDLEMHRKASSRRDSQGSDDTPDYLVLYDDWKAVEGNGLIVRRKKGSDERKDRRRVFDVESSPPDEDSLAPTTSEGVLDLTESTDTQMSDAAGVYGSCDPPELPASPPKVVPNPGRGALPLPKIDVSKVPAIKTPDENSPPPIPVRNKPEEVISSSPRFARKPSRFMAKEPLFQIYQADIRRRDSKVVLRPRTVSRSKRPPIPARTFLKNRNNPPPVPPQPQPNRQQHQPQNHKQQHQQLQKQLQQQQQNHKQQEQPQLIIESNKLSEVAPPPLPARNVANLSNLSNLSHLSSVSSNMSHTSSNSSGVSPRVSQAVMSTEIRSSLQKELFAKLNTSSTSPLTNKMDNVNDDDDVDANFTSPLLINNNIRSGESHRIVDNSRTCSGNGVVIRTSGGNNERNSSSLENANANGNSAEGSRIDDMLMEDPTYMSANEGSSSTYSCEEDMISGEMDRNRTHGSSMETRSSQQSAGEGAIDDEESIYHSSMMEDPIYQSGLGDPTYQPGMNDPTYHSGIEDATYQSGMNDPTYQSGMDDPTYHSGMEDATYQSGMDDPTYHSGMEDGTYQSGMEDPVYHFNPDLEEEDAYDVFDEDFDDDDDYYQPPSQDGPVREGSSFFRSYWCALPEVISSGLLQNLNPVEKKLQEALFEIITSEASYLRSLSLVANHFVDAPTLTSPHGVLKRPEHHSLFSNIKTIKEISERLLFDLEQHQQASILLSDVCGILLSHLRDHRFEQGFVTYCANNKYQVRMLEQFKNNAPVTAAIRELETHPDCCSLDLLSFLMLPFQRITRLPLLLEAVISRAPEGSDMMNNAVQAFTEVRKMAEKCNDEAKRMEMIEEVTLLARMMDFKQGIKKMDISQTSTIVKRGTLDSIVSQANILGGKKKAIAKRVHCIVFTDKVLVAKEKTKGDQKRYDVMDWCPRNLIQVTPIDQPSMCTKLTDGVPTDCRNIFTLNLLQNNQKKTAEYILNVPSLSERQRWMDALVPPSQTEDGETIYESWDCPQVICTKEYEATEQDELSMEVSDRVDVNKKVEGWYEGMRVGSRERGWFPATCVQEIVNDHVRARNLKKRHKILSMCEEQIRLARYLPKVK